MSTSFTFTHAQDVPGGPVERLDLNYRSCQTEVAYDIGWGTDAAQWQADQLAMINRLVKEGLRQFYAPPRLPTQTRPHRWSFLRPVETLETVAEQGDYDLPDAFGSLDGNLTFEEESGILHTISNVGEGRIRGLRQESATPGKPLFCAVRPKRHAVPQTTAQRFQLLLHPLPDAAYLLSYRCRINPDSLDESVPDSTYPPGGMIHGQTIIASCLAAAEMRFKGGKGPAWERFLERLEASVAVDLEQAPTNFGRNSDRNRRVSTRPSRTTHVTVNGIYYDGSD